MIPRYDADIYTADAIVEPYEHYRRIRDLGPVVHLTAHGLYALGRYENVRSALGCPEEFRSGNGVGINPIINRLGRGTTINSDDAEHDQRRSLVGSGLTPKALRPLRTRVEAMASSVVDAAVSAGRVDGVADIARALPLSIVPDLIGWPEDGRKNLLTWAGATFDILGPMNARAVRSLPAAASMMSFARRTVKRGTVLPDSMGRKILDAADSGEISHSSCPALMVDYLAPSLDTTISAICSALWLFAKNPEQWELVREDPSRIPNAVNEVVRIESPLRAFTRTIERAIDVDGNEMAAGSRVLMMYASANRDERKWNDPETFDVTREAGDHVGFGYGVHGCAGQGLARMETKAVLEALAAKVHSIELVGEPTRGHNNIIRGFDTLPIVLHTA